MSLWAGKIKAGDVLRCAFPLREAPDQPGPKLRPTLALAVSADKGVLLVVYGTSQAHQAPQRWHLTAEIEPGTITVFDFTRREPLPATAAYFPIPPGKRTPVIATLPAARMAEIAAALKAAKAQR